MAYNNPFYLFHTPHSFFLVTFMVSRPFLQLTNVGASNTKNVLKKKSAEVRSPEGLVP